MIDNNIEEKRLDAINKALELSKDVYNDAVKKPLSTISSGLDLCLNYIGAIVSPIMHKYIVDAEYKIKEIDEQIRKKYEKIPKECRVEPRMNILGPATELLKYNLNELQIRDIFINILINEMDKTKQTMVLPSFINVVGQLSYDDAQFLKKIYSSIKSGNGEEYALEKICMKIEDDPYSYIDLGKAVVFKNPFDNAIDVYMVDPVVLDNLSRLGLIDTSELLVMNDTQLYEKGFVKINQKYDENERKLLYYKKGVLNVTDYGFRFLKVCLDSANY